MPRNHARTARAAPGRAGAVLLLFGLVGLVAGCDAIYDDTKGWANRLEASILEAAHELEKDPEAETPDHYTPEIVEPALSPTAGTTSAMTPVPMQLPLAPGSRKQTSSSGTPEGTVADAAGTLVVPAAPDNAAGKQAGRDAVANPPAPAQKEAKQAAESGTDAAEKPLPPLPKRKPQMAKAGATAKPGKAVAAAEAKAAAKGPAAQATGAKTPDAVAMVLHLSSLRSEEAAKREWRTLKRDFPVALGKMEAEIRRTELGEKGIFYRVLAGPLPSRTLAQETCDAVKARNVRQYCRVVPSTPAENSPS